MEYSVYLFVRCEIQYAAFSARSVCLLGLRKWAGFKSEVLNRSLREIFGRNEILVFFSVDEFEARVANVRMLALDYDVNCSTDSFHYHKVHITRATGVLCTTK